ncbi:Citreoviridin biosynthesis protein D [Hypsizygus marmoreus]|uniref:Citreoviridin biosynthesis protein D n=1 Tax=Hypsizygus marmoreus TaxID=39966 RepID=A0A369JHJ9_HYPMA|nr:Citreoviridin biosynthesis protein D [Hypsizygus marmoreus]
MSKVLRDVVLPLIVFSVLIAFAWRFIFGHLHESGLDVALANACSPKNTSGRSYRIPYTGFDKIDGHVLCPLVAFFHEAMESSDAITFLTYFVGIGGPLSIIPSIEGWRQGRRLLIAYPVIFGLLSQTLTIGVTMPMYWLIFLLSGGANTGRNGNPGGAKITQAHAEAIVFGIVVGGVIPSVGMLLLEDPLVTAIWQPYPIYISLAQLAHLAFRRVSKHPDSGYSTIRALYIGAFIVSSSVHISTIWPLLKDVSTLQNVFLPSIIVPNTSASLSIRVLHFLKWDFTFGFLSSIVATLWFARSMGEFLALVAWSIIATPVFGPGAALTGTALWRESTLQVESAPSKAKQT